MFNSASRLNWVIRGMSKSAEEIVEKAVTFTGSARISPCQLTVAVPTAVFAFDSAFPGPGIFKHLESIEKMSIDYPETRLAVFGHTDKTGSREYNKKLSDRRAKAVLALLTKDLNLFDDIAKEEDWNLRCYQAMLRAVGCNPGAIDGRRGPMTQTAIRWFQQEYNQDIYHQANVSRAHPEIVVDGKIGPKTRVALRDAYVSIAPASISKDRFSDPAYAGCSEFNPISYEDAENRRVIVAFIETQQPRNGEFPCQEGNISACEIEGRSEIKCAFYRRFFHEKKGSDLPVFFDFQWLKEENGKAHLSALTSLPDGTNAIFTIFRSEQRLPSPLPDSSSGSQRPSLGSVLGTVNGKIAGGVCYARWTPPEDFDPFDVRYWLVDHDVELKDEEEGGVSPELTEPEVLLPPVFCIDAGRHWGYSGPPSNRLNRLFFVDDPNAEGVALLTNGTFVKFSSSGGKLDAEDEYEVVSLVVTDQSTELEEGEGETIG
jgi:hypothetical protein